VADAEQALRELEWAVELAVRVRQEGAHGSNLGAFVDDVLRRRADLTAAGLLDEASAAVDGAFVEWERAEAGRRKAAQAAGLRLLEAGLTQDLLRRDAVAAAAKVAKRVEMETPDPAARFAALMEAQDEWYARGRDKGLNLDLAVSVEIARMAVDVAGNADERGGALNNLGNALATLGAREGGAARLEEAVAAYRAALEEQTRERAPLQWATTQTNLGNALHTLGEREGGTARLEAAVAAYRAAMEEWTRERVPLDWAMTQNNLGNALRTLGERESGPARLEAAVAACRAALEEFTRERVPLDWATTQNNLGNALLVLGARESGTARLEAAVAAYRAALEELTRERVPLDWAQTTGNLGVALAVIAERTGDAARAGEAVAALAAARDVSREGGHGPNADYYAARLAEAEALRARLGGW
jgi:tetratricopeptide (TPR) repeat protein